MIGMKFDTAKGLFFDYRKINQAADRATFRNLTIFGGYTRKTARNSMKQVGKKAQKAVLLLLTALKSPGARYNSRYRAQLEAQLAQARRAASSPPGKPPRAILGLIKKLMVFAIDKAKKSVVIGPTLKNGPSGAPATLEEGGTARIQGRSVRILRRPYMGPAFQKARAGLSSTWKNSIR